MPAAVTRHTIDPALWAGLALGPVGWALNHQAGYVVATTRCGPYQPLMMLAVAGVALLLVLAGLALCWRARRTPADSRTTGSARSERHFAAEFGVLTNLLFAGVILAQVLAHLFLAGCAA
jgi:hypothetical protein